MHLRLGLKLARLGVGVDLAWRNLSAPVAMDEADDPVDEIPKAIGQILVCSGNEARRGEVRVGDRPTSRANHQRSASVP